ncbi:MAG: DUF294 nucleotidyltransferase-like domain-containing protein [Pseudomonadota bacterium]
MASHSAVFAGLVLESSLGSLRLPPLVAVPRDTPLADALARMQQRHAGAIVVLDDAHAAAGIVTHEDVMGRVTLAGRDLATPIAEVMSAPVHTLCTSDTAQDALLLMLRAGIGHVPVTERGRVVGLVSERDIAQLQRLSVLDVSASLRTARDEAALVVAAQEVRCFAESLLSHGVGARQITPFISHLNDLLTQRLVELLAGQEGLDLRRACWLAFGSEGRCEQTIATDQDNGLVFDSEAPDDERARWLRLGQRVNEALQRCGFPLCKGQVMAGRPHCCLSLHEWCERLDGWMAHGAPQDLLAACIYFDLRPVAGQLALAQPLRERITDQAQRLPRFIKQMAENALRNKAPLNWRGAIETEEVGGHARLNLKFHGTTLFVDAARVYALAQGVALTGTRARFEAAAERMRVPPHESKSWIVAFEFLQMLRLQAQVTPGATEPGRPNLIALDALNDIDRKVLKEALREARHLQQRMALDYLR